MLVESAVLTANASVPAFFRGVLERSEVEVWSLAIYALGEILTCIGVAAWEGRDGSLTKAGAVIPLCDPDQPAQGEDACEPWW